MTRTVFGIVTTQATTLTIQGHPLAANSVLHHAHIDDGDPARWLETEPEGDKWTYQLAADTAYAFRLEDEHAEDECTLSVNVDAILVSRPSSGDAKSVVSGALVAPGDLLTGNPKDPWPPPPPPPPPSASTAQLAWFDSALGPYLGLPRGGDDDIPDRPDPRRPS